MPARILSSPRVFLSGRLAPGTDYVRLGTAFAFEVQQDHQWRDLVGIGSHLPYETIAVGWRGGASAEALVLAPGIDASKALEAILLRPTDLLAYVRRLLEITGTDLLVTDVLTGNAVLEVRSAQLTSEIVSIRSRAVLMRRVRWQLTQPF